ncbi:Domain of unknown function DUF4333 [Candidatus Nanopelagicaceae bacterium]
MTLTPRLIALGLISLICSTALTSCSTVDQITGVDLDVSRVEQTIEDGILDQADIYVVATCPDPMAGQVGDTRTCSIEDDYGDTELVDVTIQNDQGDIVWEVRQ